MTANKNEYPSQSSPDISEDELDPETLAFLERMNAAYSNLKTKNQELTELYEAGKFDSLENEIEAIVDSIADESPEVAELLTSLKHLRSFGNRTERDAEESKQIIDKIKSLRAYYRTLVINEAGLPDEARFNAIESSRNHVAEMLNDNFGNSSYTSDEALTVLGIYNYDEDGNCFPRFPEELVPPSTNELWETYLASVIAHEKTCSDLAKRIAGVDKSSVEIADKTRTYAHDAIKKELHSILNLQPTNTWEALDTRKLLADIRDQVLPTYTSLTSKESLDFMDSRQASLIASQKLSTNKTK